LLRSTFAEAAGSRAHITRTTRLSRLALQRAKCAFVPGKRAPAGDCSAQCRKLHGIRTGIHI